jgi:acyl-CoA dehydrogenase
MDFTPRPELKELRAQVRAFVDEKILPSEAAIVEEDRTKKRDTLRALQHEARRAGLWTPHLPRDLGGRGLGIMGMCALFREMGRSPVGATVFNCDAPDQGNMELLRVSATDAVRERWLKPLCNAEISSAFCMTEPAPGAGADPSNLKTRAEPDGDGFRISGQKWFSTGGGDASFLIVMARTGEQGEDAATMFVVDRHAEGITHVRDVPTMAPGLLAHREAELRFEGVKVGPEAVLGSVGEGFRLAQVRLVPARLTHCMRWLGLAERTLDLCRGYVTSRTAFGKVLAQHQMTQLKISEAASAIHAGNLMTMHCAWMLEQGLAKEARPYSSMAKNHVARLLCKTLDDAIQMHGALGFSEDMPFSAWYRYARSARIADGPDEVHDAVVARDYLRGKLDVLV